MEEDRPLFTFGINHIQVKKLQILLLLFLSTFKFITAQHSVMNFSDEYTDIRNKSLLIIPFEPFMYQSEINKELCEENKINGEEVCRSFSKGIDQSFQYIFRNKCEVNSFYYLEETRRQQDLSFVFQNRKLEYVQHKSGSNKPSGIKAFLSKRENGDKEEGVQNGQVVSIEDHSKKYMKAVANNLLIDSLKRQFRSDFILFVNQLDIKNLYGSVYEMANMDYERKIDLHYTLYNSNGEVISTGISSTSFPASVNDIDTIVSEYFPILAENIYNDLFDSSIN